MREMRRFADNWKCEELLDLPMSSCSPSSGSVTVGRVRGELVQRQRIEFDGDWVVLGFAVVKGKEYLLLMLVSEWDISGKLLRVPRGRYGLVSSKGVGNPGRKTVAQRQGATSVLDVSRLPSMVQPVGHLTCLETSFPW